MAKTCAVLKLVCKDGWFVNSAINVLAENFGPGVWSGTLVVHAWLKPAPMKTILLFFSGILLLSLSQVYCTSVNTAFRTWIQQRKLEVATLPKIQVPGERSRFLQCTGSHEISWSSCIAFMCNKIFFILSQDTITFRMLLLHPKCLFWARGCNNSSSYCWLFQNLKYERMNTKQFLVTFHKWQETSPCSSWLRLKDYASRDPLFVKIGGPFEFWRKIFSLPRYQNLQTRPR